MSSSKTLYPLLSTGSTQEEYPDMTEKSVDLGLKNQIKQTKTVYTCQLVPYAGNWINFYAKFERM